MLCSVSSSHTHSPLNNHSYHSTSIIQSHPTSPISPASPTPSTQHQHDTSTHFLHHLFSLNEIDPALCHHYFPLAFILIKKYKNTSNFYDSEIDINNHDNVEDTYNNKYIS